MKISLQQTVTSLVALLFAILAAVYIYENPARVGDQPLFVRAFLLSITIFSIQIAIYPFCGPFKGRLGMYIAIVCAPLISLVFFFYLFLLPTKTGMGLSAEQLASSLISDRSSNGIIEVGFSYPIFTPEISVRNTELFTRSVNIFLRMEDSSGENTLFRGVRLNVPGNSLSVESTVQGMLSHNNGYLFNPLVLAPDRTLSGRVVFIISNLEDGSSFTQALRSSSHANFELWDSESGQLLLEFPLQHI